MGLSPQYVVEGLVRRGIPRAAALGFAGNFVAESNLDPAINEIKPVVPGSRGGFGLAQWTGPRRRQLEAFAASRGKSVSDPELQFDFLAWELQNTEKNAAQSIFASTDPVEAARLVSERFLRPGIPNLNKRLSATSQIAGGTFTGGGGSGGGGSSGGEDDPLLSLEEIRAMLQGEEPAAPEQPAQPSAADVYAGSGAMDLLSLDEIRAMMRPIDGTDAATGAPMAMTPPRADAPMGAPVEPPASNLRGKFSEPGFEAAGQFAEQAAQGPLGYLPNIALSALTGLSGAAGYAVGGAADLAIAAGAPRQGTERLARDIMAMPEAFAGSPAQASRIATAPRVAGQVETPPAPRVEPPVTRPGPALSMDDVQGLLVSAQGRGRTSREAIKRLAQEAKINPEVAAAADRLGIDLPVDVFSESVAVTELAGALRGVKTGSAAADFFTSVKVAQDKAREAMRTLDEGQSIAEVSENVMTSLRGTQSALRSQATELYQAIDAKVPPSTRVEAPNTSRILSEMMTDYGGTSRMSDKERELIAAITNDKEPLTYKGLVKLKQDVGKSLSGRGPYKDANTAVLERLYGGLSEDQLAMVENIGGAELGQSLRAANKLVAQRKELEERIVGAFGKDLEGSIANKLTTAIRQSSKGDIGGLNRILNVIPKDLQRETIATAIGEISSVRRGSEPGAFSFDEFSKTYQGLRKNAPVYKRVVEVLGPEGHAMMEDLYRVSAAVSRAKAAISSTGQSNQILEYGPLAAEGLVSRVLSTTAGRTAVRATTTGAFGAAGGIPAAIAADSVSAALTMGKPSRIEAAGNLLSSDQFKKLAIEAATKPEISDRARRAVLVSPEFRKFARVSGIDNPEAWLRAAIAGTIATEGAQE